MKVYFGTDHGGYDLKEELKKYVQELGCGVVDKGAFALDPEDDYPDFVIPAAEAVAADAGSLGIVLGRSGNGEQIAANKVKGIRAALCLNTTMAIKAKEHNHANVLSIGADYTDPAEVRKIVKAFLETPFSSEERHQRRIDKISAHE